MQLVIVILHLKHFIVLILGNISLDAKKIITNCESQTYQKEIIEKFYVFSKIDHTLEAFWNFPIACQSFCYLLDFIEKHNPNLIKNIDVPLFENFSNRLTLANHTLQQLNIIDDGIIKGKIDLYFHY